MIQQRSGTPLGDGLGFLMMEAPTTAQVTLTAPFLASPRPKLALGLAPVRGVDFVK